MAASYSVFGAGVASFGAVVAYLSYFVLYSVPFTALGVACVILGGSTMTLPEHPIPKGAVKGVIHGSVLNVEALLEEFDTKERALYVPPKDGVAVAFVPLSGDRDIPSYEALSAAPRRLVSEVEGVPLLMVVPPGSELARAGELAGDSSVEDALEYVLVDTAELCSSVRAVSAENRWVVELKGVKVKTEAAKYLHCLGSIPASVAASVITTVTQRGISLASEELDARRSVVIFKMM